AGRPAALPCEPQTLPVRAEPPATLVGSPAARFSGGIVSGPPQYSNGEQVPLCTVRPRPTRLTWRVATWSVVSVRFDELESASVSSRFTGICTRTTPFAFAFSVTVGNPLFNVYVAEGTSPEQVTRCRPRSAVHVGNPVAPKKPGSNAPTESGSPTLTVML